MMKNMAVQVLDETVNFVGESPLWHPQRNTLYWLDFPNNILFSYQNGHAKKVKLKVMVTALGWIDHAHLLMATSEGLFKYHIDSQVMTLIVNIEDQLTTNRSNDGRADPWGGFWVGTMNVDAKAKCGAFYRWHNGQLRKLISELSIPNGMCFDKARAVGYFADSLEQKLYVVKLDVDTGWPTSAPTIFYDFSELAVSPDGAVVDVHGNIWIALWDGGEVMCISPQGKHLHSVDTDTPRPTCPAFGGSDATTLFVTSAACELDKTPVKTVQHGTTLFYPSCCSGVFEPAVTV
ncbi:SMP-30/gluconolactonase/LRE family protein [Pseudoalteromonas sp. S1727]|uniref:SMP-30/gluconolactonase/LRE family protein n=1 Tax=Pseudoalteromonas sp. S1727 TaxID=2066514 RepID=UPI001485D6A5|nr:SMP-30/gluconolactonase/LRE family protein [Pseudoalteromonas sp. S1727]